MRPDNPAGQPCAHIERGPVHQWNRLADGTAYCLHCGVQLSVAQTADAFPPSKEKPVNKKAGGKVVVKEPIEEAPKLAE